MEFSSKSSKNHIRYYDYKYTLSVKHPEMTDKDFEHYMTVKTKYLLTEAVKKIDV